MTQIIAAGTALDRSVEIALDVSLDAALFAGELLALPLIPLFVLLLRPFRLTSPSAYKSTINAHGTLVYVLMEASSKYA